VWHFWSAPLLLSPRNFRRIATRYDKPASRFSAFVALVALDMVA